MRNILRRVFYTLTLFFCVAYAIAQENSAMMQQVKEMAKETSSAKNLATMKNIISTYKLDSLKDAETIDMLKGLVAISYSKEGNYTAFGKTIASIKNKFNQTSYLNMAATELIASKKDLPIALQLSKQTIDLYNSFKDDPAAKPADFEAADWKRFMSFAYYPYMDTHAWALYANGNYKDALSYQQKAFDKKPEEGLPLSVERYAHLLALNNQADSAKSLLLHLAKSGKLNAGMTAQLKSLYLKDGGNEKDFEHYLSGLQKNVQQEIGKELVKYMLNETAPAFTLKDLGGKQVKLADFKGKTVVLDLWATWCVPCIASFPAMQKLITKHKDVVFLFIAVQEKEPNALARVRDFVKKNRYTFNVLMDQRVGQSSSYQVLSAYQPSGIPSKYVIDKNGVLRFKSIGFTTDTELINEMDAMLAIVNHLPNQ